ncbi:MAG: hypothetical protein RSC24_17050 [Clostridium sp.]
MRTLYYYFDKNVFTARNIDLPRKVKYKPRKKSRLPVIKESTDRVGRTFDDFIKFIEDNPNVTVVDMDTPGNHRITSLYTLRICTRNVIIPYLAT